MNIDLEVNFNIRISCLLPFGTLKYTESLSLLMTQREKHFMAFLHKTMMEIMVTLLQIETTTQILNFYLFYK